MILTGSEIQREVEMGNIVLSPFEKKHLNPNSYNYRLGEVIKVYRKVDGKNIYLPARIPNEGFLLEAGDFALGHTLETIGSSRYAASLIGRSSIGRLGLFVQISANLGHVNSIHQWTLELFAAMSVWIYPFMTIGQVSFWKSTGDLPNRKERYSAFNGPQEALLHEGAARQ
jgi:dCTP deaminase